MIVAVYKSKRDGHIRREKITFYEPERVCMPAKEKQLQEGTRIDTFEFVGFEEK